MIFILSYFLLCDLLFCFYTALVIFTRKHLFCYSVQIRLFGTRHSTEGETFSPIQASFNSGIGLVPENVVMVAIDVCGKSPL